MIPLSEERTRKRRKRHKWLLLFVVALLLLSAGSALGQQAATRESKELNAKSANGKADLPTEALPQKQATDLGTIDSVAILRSARVIFVRSNSILVKGAVVEDKLQKRPEFQQLGLLITRDASAADLILELRHDLFTMYVYTAVDPKTQIVAASGKLSSLGGTVAGKVAKRFLQQLAQAR